MRWFDIWWYKYLFSKEDDSGYCSWLDRLKCRIKCHPRGYTWYNPNGFWPDYHCKDCGDYL
jgi:hypothetical protein